MAEPVFLYLATYGTEAEAQADYDDLKGLHRDHLVHTYDVALVTKDEEGKVHVHKHEKPTQYGVVGGAIAGVVASIVFPPFLIVNAIALTALGAAAGGFVAHLSSGVSRKDAAELGELIKENAAAIMIVGKEETPQEVKDALNRSVKEWEGDLGLDREQFEKQLAEAVKSLES